MGWQHGKQLEIKPTSGRFLPNTSSWVSSDRKRGLMVHHCCHVVDALQCSAVGARLRTFSRAARVFAYKSGPSGVCRVDTPLWPRARPLLRDLTSVPAARATMSWHGQAKQPMMLRGQSAEVREFISPKCLSFWLASLAIFGSVHWLYIQADATGSWIRP